MMKSTYLMKRLITPNHVLLPCPQLSTLISIFPDATAPQQILGTLSARQHWARLETIHNNNNNNLHYLCDGTTATRPITTGP